LELCAGLVEDGKIELVGECVDDGGTDAEAGEATGAGKKVQFGKVLPRSVVLGKFVVDEFEEMHAEVAGGVPFVVAVV